MFYFLKFSQENPDGTGKEFLKEKEKKKDKISKNKNINNKTNNNKNEENKNSKEFSNIKFGVPNNINYTPLYTSNVKFGIKNINNNVDPSQNKINNAYDLNISDSFEELNENLFKKNLVI